MIVDSSALLAILLDAPDGPALLDALIDAERPRMSVANWLEVSMLIEARGGRLASLRFDEFFRATGIELTPVDAAQASAARIAWRHFGRHKHSARLNFGDCFAYALAKQTGERLLYQGEDFARTDITSALATPMPEFFCELLSEEIPARLQPRGAEEFARIFTDAFAALKPTAIRTFYGPRRIALAADIEGSVAESATVERGPRLSAPEAALAGFLRKHGASRDKLVQEGEFWVLHKIAPSVAASDLLAVGMPALLRRFSWPKSMRWGGTSSFTWVRPLRRICCVLSGEPVAFSLATVTDDGHGLVAGDVSEGHRMLSPAPFQVTSAADWLTSLRQSHVIADAVQRERLIIAGLSDRASAADVTIVPDEGLIAEVAGLVEWPVALLGRIDDASMDLPPEVMQISMRVNQRYFATRTAEGAPAAYFAFIANIDAPDGGAAIIAGNERVLRARFSDARHFWDQDRRTRLETRVAALDGVTFHAKLGTQGARVRRLVRLAEMVAEAIGASPARAARAALLAKADLTTGMVGEFPELQGVMGAYYARHDGEEPAVADAIRDHYAPRGASDAVPLTLCSAAVAMADKLDQLMGFFAVGEKPTGSGDPFALRRAALGVIRILREHKLDVNLRSFLPAIAQVYADTEIKAFGDNAAEVQEFIHERLRVILRAEGLRPDVISAVSSSGDAAARSDVRNFADRAASVEAFIKTDDGINLLAAYKRISNILGKRGSMSRTPHGIQKDLLVEPAESRLDAVLTSTEGARSLVNDRKFTDAMVMLSKMRPDVDAFFDTVRVNDDVGEIAQNRLELLAKAQAQMDYIAFFEAIAS